MIMNYDHNSPMASLDALEKEWDVDEQKVFENTFLTPVEQLPTRPETEICTNLLTTELSHVGLPRIKKGFTKKLKNPIDYTSIRDEDFLPGPPAHEIPPYSPLPSRVPALRRIDLKIWAEEAVGNKY